jgi:hypothetical protein
VHFRFPHAQAYNEPHTQFTFFFFSDGKAEAYPAGRDKASIVSFLEKKAESAPQPALVVDKIPKMKVKALKKAIAARGLACVGCSDKKMLVSFLTKHADMPVLSALKAELAVKAYTNKLQGKKTKAKSAKKSSGRTVSSASALVTFFFKSSLLCLRVLL